MRGWRPAVLAGTLATTLCATLRAQARGGVEGRVTDALGRPLAAAQVSAERQGLVPPAQATTGPDGAWRILDLTPGTYRITVARAGYRSFRQDVDVVANATSRVTVVLELVRFTLDTLLVSAPVSPVSTANAELSTKLTMAEISVLPTTLELRQLIALTPGARPDQIWGGASDQANAYTLDGTTVNHPGVGGAFFLPSPSWVQTLEVRGLGAGADVGGAQGGLVEVTTLDGGTMLQGALRTSFESHQLNGSNLVPEEIGRELSRRWEVDGQIRGPLVQDRLHFALFGHAIRQGELVVNQLPFRSGTFVPEPPSMNDYRWLGKLSWKSGDRDVLQGSIMGRHVAGERVGQTVYELGDATERLRQWNLTGNLTWQRTWSPQSALTVSLGGYLARERRDPYAGPLAPGIEIWLQANPPRYQNALLRTRAAPSSLGLTATWTRRGQLDGLEHELKLGGEYTLGGWDFQQLRNGGMSWRPLWVQGFDPAVPSTWVYGGAIPTAWGGEVRIDSRVQNAALFIQEQISLRPWLRLTPGYRFGWWTGALTPVSGPRFTAVEDYALEPRIGLVAELKPLLGLVAKAHWGRYHQPMFAALFDRAEGAGAYTDEEIWSYLGPAPASPTQTFTLAERDSMPALWRLEEAIQLDPAGRVEDYRQPYVDQTVLSLERAFSGRWKVGLVYVHRRNHDLVALVDRNLAQNYTVVENVIVRDRYRLRGKIKSITPVVFGTSDGMKSSECNGSTQPAGVKTRDGRLWFPTTKGVSVIDPDAIRINRRPPSVLIESIVADDREAILTGRPDAISFDPDTPRLEINYNGISLSAPEKVCFRYRLEGFERDWIDAGSRRVAYYTNLPPGNYRFSVMAGNKDGVWNENVASHEFYLAPHFYQRYWFYLLCAVLVASTVFGIHQIRCPP